MASRTAPQHRAEASRSRTRRWFLRFTAARPARRPRPRRGASRAQLHRVRPSVASDGQRISGDDEGPGIHSWPAIRFSRASTLLRASSARIRISTIAPNSRREAERRDQQRPEHRGVDRRGAAHEADALALVERVPPDHRIMDDRQVDRADQAEDGGEPPLPAFLLLGAGERDDSRDRGRAGPASRSSARPIPNRCPRSAGPRASRWRGRGGEQGAGHGDARAPATAASGWRQTICIRLATAIPVQPAMPSQAAGTWT